MIPSPKVATYDLQPEMSAEELCEAILPELKQETADFVCLNFANPDMVGHTGVFEAVIKAVETVDRCAERIVKTGIAHGYRSEEHTSELQSLMRISYAVFCLKKKKKNKMKKKKSKNTETVPKDQKTQKATTLLRVEQEQNRKRHKNKHSLTTLP